MFSVETNITLPAGEHKLNFEVQLPAELPSSFERNIGHIRYYCSATMVRPRKNDQRCKAPFTVIHPLDLNTEPNIAVSVFHVFVSSFCKDNYPVSMQICEVLCNFLHDCVYYKTSFN